jgi:hypothetical protein
MQAEIEAPVRGELFKVVDGQIVAIETVLRNVPLGADMGWGPREPRRPDPHPCTEPRRLAGRPAA